MTSKVFTILSSNIAGNKETTKGALLKEKRPQIIEKERVPENKRRPRQKK
jgi:hypothetical protein